MEDSVASDYRSPWDFFVALNDHRIRWLVLGLAAMLVLFAQSSRTRLTTDPVVYAAIARTMADSGDYGALKIGEEPYYNKPPLLFWLSALAIRIFGPTVSAATLFSRLFAVGCVFLTGWLGSRLYEEKVGWVAALILLTTHLFFRNSAIFRLESGLTFGILVSVYGYFNGERTWGPLVFYLGVCVAVLAKAFPGFLPLVIVPIHGLLSTPFELWPKKLVRWLLWSPLVLLPCLWWVHLATTDGQAPIVQLLSDLGRTKQHKASWIEEFWNIYIVEFAKTYWPWLPFAGAGMWMSLRDFMKPEMKYSTRPVIGFLLAWVVIVFASSALKNAQYLRYVYIALPAISIFAANAVIRFTTQKLFDYFAGIVALTMVMAALAIACFAAAIPLRDVEQYQAMAEILDHRLAAKVPIPMVKIKLTDDQNIELRRREKARAFFFLGRNLQRVSIDELQESSMKDRVTFLIRKDEYPRLKALLPVEILFRGDLYHLAETIRK
jgi:4-amino-4-deoxy-L-arabinose transferase-like glycosyltransferase